MLQLTVKMHDSDSKFSGKTFGSAFTKRIKDFEQAVLKASEVAAATANKVTAEHTRNIRPPVPQRPGRRTTQGNMARYLMWKPDGNLGVEFNMALANQRVPYWIIQEVGTGETATLKRYNAPNPRGRQAAGTSQIVIPSQIGRVLPSFLAFGTGSGGTYTAFGAATGQGLFLRKKLKGAPVFAAKGRGELVRITKEIEGKHFIAKGSTEGFRQYRKAVLAAGKASLYKPKTFP